MTGSPISQPSLRISHKGNLKGLCPFKKSFPSSLTNKGRGTQGERLVTIPSPRVCKTECRTFIIQRIVTPSENQWYSPVHELVITQNLLDTVLAEAKKVEAKEVTGVHLIVGELSGVASDCVELYFDMLKKDTVAGGATIDFTAVTAELRCRDCHTEFHPGDEAIWVCPSCSGYSIEILKGRDCYIESIEVER